MERDDGKDLAVRFQGHASLLARALLSASLCAGGRSWYMLCTRAHKRLPTGVQRPAT